MCANTNYRLTMDGLLNDPLTQMLMRSDGVSHEEHADLWERTRETAIARFALQTQVGLVTPPVNHAGRSQDHGRCGPPRDSGRIFDTLAGACSQG